VKKVFFGAGSFRFHTQKGPEIFASQPTRLPYTISLSPSTANSKTMLKLFCLLQGQPFVKAFPVNIENGETIGDLKKLVKGELKSNLEGVDASDLELWKVSILHGDLNALDEASRRIDRGEQIHLDPMDVVGELFPEPPPKTVHIMIKAPGKSPARTSVFILLLDLARPSPLPMYLRMLTCSLCMQL
jgi:hypothetical protein